MKKEKLDIKKVNEVINLGDKVTKILYIIIGIISVYFLTLLFKELKIFNIVITVIKVFLPFFIGIFIAWLFNPFVKFLQRKSLDKGFAIFIVYFLIVAFLYVFFVNLVPLLIEQINIFFNKIPTFIEYIASFFEKISTNFETLPFLNFEKTKDLATTQLNNSIQKIVEDIPYIIVAFFRLLVNGIISLLIGLLIGFYLLFDIGKVKIKIKKMVPKKIIDSFSELLILANKSLFSFIKGTLFIAFIISLFSFISLKIIGVETALLLGIICGITNLIPYLGPFIGGGIAALVAFTQNFQTGILAIGLMVVLQTLENGILQPLVMGKTMKLKPVVIMLGLLIFGDLFGIFGMVVATPIIATLRTIFVFFNKKYKIFKAFN